MSLNDKRNDLGVTLIDLALLFKDLIRELSHIFASCWVIDWNFLLACLIDHKLDSHHVVHSDVILLLNLLGMLSLLGLSILLKLN